MLGTLNRQNDFITNFSDSSCTLKIGKVNSFIMMMNLEALDFDNNSHADLLLIHKNASNKVEVFIFELKGVEIVLKKTELEKMQKSILNKFHGTIKCFPETNNSSKPTKDAMGFDNFLSSFVKVSKPINKTYILVIPPEFMSQMVKFKTSFEGCLKKYAKFRMIPNDDIFTP
ncbi:MAG: hypothetical protein ACYDAO_03920 [Thermoplasmataceae archaeon]